MRVLVAGATGVLGRAVLPALEAAGHEVVGFSRRGDGDRLRAVDALDGEAVAGVADEVRPEAVVNLLTAIPARINPRKIGEVFELTNRLRTEGSRNLLSAAPDAHHVAESIAFIYDPAPGLASEDDPIWREPPRAFAPILAAVRQLERQTLDAGGAVLRLGYLYGPGSAFDEPDGAFARDTRARRMPIAGSGAGVLSFVHADDAASAFVAAVDRRARGVFNIGEDDPESVRDWLPRYAAHLGAQPPRHVPGFLVRLIAGGYGVAFYESLRGASNTKAKAGLGWAPDHRFPDATREPGVTRRGT
jgi:nucleoside-diphosphate-sugar epimerase